MVEFNKEHGEQRELEIKFEGQYYPTENGNKGLEKTVEGQEKNKNQIAQTPGERLTEVDRSLITETDRAKRMELVAERQELSNEMNESRLQERIQKREHELNR